MRYVKISRVLMARVTKTFSGLLPVADVILKIPVYVPGCKPYGSILTEKVSGVVEPLTELMTIQFPPSMVDAETLTAEPEGLVDIVIGCAAGKGPPMSYAREREGGLAEMVPGGPITVSVTGMLPLNWPPIVILPK
jgi:hypothetical protein